jgi:hypothetical protein
VAAPVAHLEEPVGVLLALWTSAGAVPHRRVAGEAEPARMEVGDKEKRARPSWFILHWGRQGQLGFRTRWLNWSRGRRGRRGRCTGRGGRVGADQPLMEGRCGRPAGVRAAGGGCMEG